MRFITNRGVSGLRFGHAVRASSWFADFFWIALTNVRRLWFGSSTSY
jgi:hypothetical protein